MFSHIKHIKHKNKQRLSRAACTLEVQKIQVLVLNGSQAGCFECWIIAVLTWCKDSSATQLVHGTVTFHGSQLCLEMNDTVTNLVA